MKTISSFVGGHYFLSNSFPCRAYFEGAAYRSVEHAFQACKTFDSSSRELIRRQVFPGTAFRMGREVSLRADWELVKDEFMLNLLRVKFSSIRLQERLLRTGEAELINGNSRGDQLWGAVAINGVWVGENRLGKMLEVVRREIQFA